MKVFDSEVKAQEWAKRLQNQSFTKFCPLIGAICNIECICFEDVLLVPTARSNIPSPPVYVVYPKRCTNVMFMGQE